MKRFVLLLVLVPIIAAAVTTVVHAIRWVDPSVFRDWVRVPGYILWFAYLDWLVPALAVATADRLLRSYQWQRLLTIAVVGSVSAELAIYGLPPSSWRWGMLVPILIGAIAPLICCLLLDHVTMERLRQFGSRIHETIRTLRRWPEPG
jgi:hypothetical protein